MHKEHDKKNATFIPIIFNLNKYKMVVTFLYVAVYLSSPASLLFPFTHYNKIECQHYIKPGLQSKNRIKTIQNI